MTRRKAAWFVLAAFLTALPPVLATPAGAHGERIDVVVEAVVGAGDDPGRVDYGIALTFADGNPVTGAGVVISAPGVEDVPAPETTPGIYIGEIRLPPGATPVTIAFDEGSVQFTQRVDTDVGAVSIVMVDTVDPSRVGARVTDDSAILSDAGDGAATTTGTVPLVVEALVADEFDPLAVTYTVGLSRTNPDTVVDVAAVAKDGTAFGPVSLPAVAAGVLQGTVRYPTASRWVVTLTAGGIATVEFVENLPWPHFSTDAGRHKVKLDSAHPEREGTFVEDSIFVSEGESAAPPTTVTGAPAPGDVAPAPLTAAEDVVVDLPDPRSELTQDIVLRILHLLAIATWVLPLAASAWGRSPRHLTAWAASGFALTLVTGGLLALFGAPTSFPGLVAWNELGDRLYGSAYQTAFVVKMGFVLVAAALTAVAVRRRSIRGAVLTLGSIGGAAVAVTAMSQFHLFSHL